MSLQPFNVTRLVEELARNQPAQLRFHFFDNEQQRRLKALVKRVLADEDMLFVADHIMTILRELVSNAIKANAKRIHFHDLGLDILDPNDYARGIDGFRNDVVHRLDEFAERLQNEQLQVTVSLRRRENCFEFSVFNNSAILPDELERVRSRIKRAMEGTQLLESYEGFCDFTEGAGLGILMIVFMLKNIGVHPPCFDVLSENDGTTTRFLLNREMQYVETASSVKAQIENEIAILPTFPATILALTELCRDPDVPMQRIVDKVMCDPALSADVMKFGRSAFMAACRNVDNIRDAVAAMGIRNLETLLMAAGTKRILSQRFGKFESVWRHARRVGAYVGIFASELDVHPDPGRLYLAGLLHDIGKIVLMSIDDGLQNQIHEILHERSTASLPQLEEISVGISHCEIGERIARKWNFPDYLIAAIRFHHTPMLAPPEFRDIIGIACLANWVDNMFSEEDEPSYFEREEILDHFKISDPKRLEDIVSRCRAEGNDILDFD